MTTLRAALLMRPPGLAKTLTGYKGALKQLTNVCSIQSGLVKSEVIPQQMSVSAARLLSTSHSRSVDSSATGGASASSGTATHAPDSTADSSVFDGVQEHLASARQVAWKVEVERKLAQLDDWVKTVQSEVREGKPVDIRRFLHQDLDEVAHYAGKDVSAPGARSKCLLILLSQDKDLDLTKKLLKRTMSFRAQLPVYVLTDVISIIHSAKATELRNSIRTELVRYVVHFRCHQIPPSQLLFYMYQLDQLVDMRRVCSENRQQSWLAGSVGEGEDGKSEGQSRGEGEDTIDVDSVKEATNAVPDFGPQGEWDNRRLEGQILRWVDRMKAKDLARAMTLMAKWKNRNEVLLKPILQRLSMADLWQFTSGQLSAVLYASSTLKLHEPEFLTKVTDQLCEVSPTNISDHCSILSHLSSLRWHNPRLVNTILDNLTDHLELISAKQAANAVMALSQLYPLPLKQDHPQLISDLFNIATRDGISALDRVGCVYSMAVLQLLTPDMATSVLTTDFVQQFKGSEEFSDKLCLQKIQTINMAARLELDNDVGPSLPDADHLILEKVDKTTQDKKLTKELWDTLSWFGDDSWGQSEMLPVDLKVDATMCVDTSGEVRPLSYLDEANSGEAFHRLALTSLPYHVVLSPEQVPVGKYRLAARLLSGMGYVPVHILYSDLQPSFSTLEKLMKIKTRITSALERRENS